MEIDPPLKIDFSQGAAKISEVKDGRRVYFHSKTLVLSKSLVIFKILKP